MMSEPNIHLVIERLVLDGLPFERSQAPHIQAAVEAELTRLIAENGIASHLQVGGAVPRVNAGELQLAAGSSSAQMGTQIAQSVYSGIGDVR